MLQASNIAKNELYHDNILKIFDHRCRRIILNHNALQNNYFDKTPLKSCFNVLTD